MFLSQCHFPTYSDLVNSTRGILLYAPNHCCWCNYYSLPKAVSKICSIQYNSCRLSLLTYYCYHTMIFDLMRFHFYRMLLLLYKMLYHSFIQYCVNPLPNAVSLHYQCSVTPLSMLCHSLI